MAEITLDLISKGLKVSPIPVPYPHSAIEYNETHYVVPVSIAKESDPDNMFAIPTDPMVGVSGGNTIVRREVADGSIRGTVKEMWRRNDWDIAISGILMTDENGTVEDYAARLVELVESRECLLVNCEYLNDVFGVTKIAVTQVVFNPAPGTDNQEFVIKAVSDDNYNLEVE